MPLKRSAGNMYPWVSHTWSVLAGECPHGCSYCYVQAMQRRFKGTRYSGPVRLVEEELDQRLGSDRTIFVEHMSDLWALEVPDMVIGVVLEHCRAAVSNTYVFQTKNPGRYREFLSELPANCLLGTTLESNRHFPEIMGAAPKPQERAMQMVLLADWAPLVRRFVTVEPVLNFDVMVLAGWIATIKPEFVNIGADSKGHGLPEPSADKVQDLIDRIMAAGIEIREKHNLGRLLGKLL